MIGARYRRRLLPLLAALATGGCDLPLGLPEWETEWSLVLAADTVDADGILPKGVRRTEAGFAVDSLVTVTEVRLEDVCEFCICYDGPIPPIEITPFDWSVPLPSGVIGARLTQGRASIALRNNISFDLLDDGLGGRGFLSVLLLDRSTGVVRDSVRIERAFPPGDTLSAHFDLAGLELTPSVIARVTGEIPGNDCETNTLTPEMGIRSEVTLRDVIAGEVDILVLDQQLNLPARQVRLPAALAGRLRPGDARLRVDVVFESTVPVVVEGLLSVAGSAEALFGPDAALYTPLPIPAGSAEHPAVVRRSFLLELRGLEGAPALHFATANTVPGNRRISVTGRERVSWQVTVHAELPVR